MILKVQIFTQWIEQGIKEETKQGSKEEKKQGRKKARKNAKKQRREGGGNLKHVLLSPSLYHCSFITINMYIVLTEYNKSPLGATQSPLTNPLCAVSVCMHSCLERCHNFICGAGIINNN